VHVSDVSAKVHCMRWGGCAASTANGVQFQTSPSRSGVRFRFAIHPRLQDDAINIALLDIISSGNGKHGNIVRSTLLIFVAS
jgi:hypothetical protein